MPASYKELKSYQQAARIYDLTAKFCDRYIDRTDRTREGTYKTNPGYRSRMWDQMVQAARSGKQNIVEGAAASKTRHQTEVKPLGVARASFKELLEDYEDFSRQRGFPQWGKDDPRALQVRGLYRSYKTDTTYETYKSYLNDPEQAANCLVTLINQTTFLIDQQINAVRIQHEEKGISFEPREQKLRRALLEKQKREAATDAWLAGFLANKEKKE